MEKPQIFIQPTSLDKPIGFLLLFWLGSFCLLSFRIKESKKPEIIKNIALIYNDLGKSEEAIAAVEKAMEQNPNDVALMQVEANVYYEMGNMERYKEIMEKVVEQDPNNSALYYNLGISSSKLGDSEAAIGYFKKAAEIDPKNTDAKINIAAEILKEEKPTQQDNLF